MLAAQAEALGGDVRCVGKPAGFRPGTVYRLARVFRDLRPDVVHTHQLGALVYGGPAARWAGVPVVVHSEHGKHYAHSRRARWLGRFAARFAGRVFGVSADIVAELSDNRVVPHRKLESAVNGIDTRKFGGANGQAVRTALGVGTGAFLVGTVGRLAEIKRQDVLVRGFALFAATAPEARLVLVGEGPERDPLEALARDLGVADRVVFAGAQPRPEEYFAAMDVFALTSRSEGTPLAILEAWAAGTPVVATAVGGVPDLIRNGETGLLVPPNDPASVAGRLDLLARYPEIRARLGRAGQDRAAAEFDVAVMANTYDRHYRALLAGGAA